MDGQISEEIQQQVLDMRAEGLVYRVIAERLHVSASICQRICDRGTIKPDRLPTDPTPEDIATQAACFRAQRMRAMLGKRSTQGPPDAKPPMHVHYEGNAVVFQADEYSDDELKR